MAFFDFLFRTELLFVVLLPLVWYQLVRFVRWMYTHQRRVRFLTKLPGNVGHPILGAMTEVRLFYARSLGNSRILKWNLTNDPK